MNEPTDRFVLLMIDTSKILSINLNAPLLQDDYASFVKRLNFLPTQPDFEVRIMGSCQRFSLLDLGYYANICIWIPTIGFHKQIPLHPINCNLVDHSFSESFAYDPLTDDYLVTLVSFDTYRGDSNTHVELFLLKANAWKKWDGRCLPYITLCEYCDQSVGLFINGAIHWIATQNDDVFVNLIVVFDLMERSFAKIALPHYFHIECDVDCCELKVFGGFFYLCAVGLSDFVGDIWMMKEYKVESSWTALHIVVPSEFTFGGYLMPIYCTKRGDIVGDDDYRTLDKFNVKAEVQEHFSYCAFYIIQTSDVYRVSAFTSQFAR